MTIEEPKHSWDSKLRKAGVLKDKHGGMDYILYGLVGATDKEKMDFEAVKRKEFNPIAKFYAPGIRDPYYTWKGKIVEKDTLRNRELPLVGE